MFSFKFKNKEEHSAKVRLLKRDISSDLAKTRAKVKRNRDVLEADSITLKISKAVGGHHGR